MKTDLKAMARDIRCDVLTSIGHLGVGHIGGCLSVVELLTVLYFEEMNVDPKEPKRRDATALSARRDMQGLRFMRRLRIAAISTKRSF